MSKISFAKYKRIQLRSLEERIFFLVSYLIPLNIHLGYLLRKAERDSTLTNRFLKSYQDRQDVDCSKRN